MPHLWLIGMMGAGKTAVGRRVADELGMPFVDLDDVIAERLGCSIAQLWGREGEAAFRDLEAAAVARVAGSDAAVVATGGGAVLREANRDAMRRSGTVVWLRAEPEVLTARVGDGDGRPLLAGGVDALGGILAEREDHYAAAAHAIVDASGTVDEVAGEVRALWNGS